MKLSRLYTNHPAEFAPIGFRDGLNVVLARILSPANRKRDTHNLGKSTLGAVLDFCLLSGKDKRFFLFKHEDIFSDYVFYLELELEPGRYLTVRRAVSDASKVGFKRHAERGSDFGELPEEEWDHWRVPFARARELLDAQLNLTALGPWDYRKGLGYLLRSQRDYSDVFQLARYAGKHSDWKPYIAHVLGFDALLVSEYYAKEVEIEEFRATERTIQSELGGSIEDLSKVEGRLLLRQRQAARQQQLLDEFDFRAQDMEVTARLVNEIDEQIGDLNSRRYVLARGVRRIDSSLEVDEVHFDVAEAARLFEEVGVLFEGQVRRDYEQLIEFNRAISEERRQYLLEERDELSSEIREITAELDTLGRQRSESLQYLGDTDALRKYKQIADGLVFTRAEVLALENQRAQLKRLQDLRADVRSAEDARLRLQERLEEDFERKNSSEHAGVYTSVRLYFDSIIKHVIDRDALLTVTLNRENHPVFSAEILDETGHSTSADLGTTYRKLLCVAFDLALLRAHLGEGYPRFVFHDGVFEGLDPRKKALLLEVIREYSDLGIQHVITLIDSDVPPPLVEGEKVFADDEVVVTLHDQGPSGRLFKIEAW